MVIGYIVSSFYVGELSSWVFVTSSSKLLQFWRPKEYWEITKAKFKAIMQKIIYSDCTISPLARGRGEGVPYIFCPRKCSMFSYVFEVADYGKNIRFSQKMVKVAIFDCFWLHKTRFTLKSMPTRKLVIY